MKNCEKYMALLDLFVDGELSLEEMLEVQAHLDECPACQAYVDDAMAIQAAFPDAEETEVPEGFAAGVMAKIQTQSAPRKKKKTPWVGVLASLAACCAIVIIQQNGPLASGGGNSSASVAYDMATEETVAECDDAVAYTVAEEAAEEAAPAEVNVDTTAAKSETDTRENPVQARTESAAFTADTAEEDAAPAEGTPSAKNAVLEADNWMEYDNVVFACVVFLPQDRVGTVLDGYEGKPYSNAKLPEEGIIGTGYALEQSEFERILYDAFDYLHGPELNQERTTDLCCIVVTETAE